MNLRDILLVKRHRQPSAEVLAGAAKLARRCGARLTFADAQESGEVDLLERERVRALEAMLKPHLEDQEARYRLIRGDLSRALADAVDEFDLVYLAGSDSQSEASRRHFAALLRESPIPLWLDGGLGRTPRRILAAVDVLTRDPVKKRLNVEVLQRALFLAAKCGAELDVLSAWTPTGSPLRFLTGLTGGSERLGPEEEKVRERLEALIGGARLTGGEAFEAPRLLVASGQPEPVIAEAAKATEADLVVAGAVGRRGLAGWLAGDTAERLSYRLTCSILAVRPEHARHRQRRAA